MVTQEYAIAYKEVLEILKHISKEELQKIPDTMLNMMETNADKNHAFNYNPKQTLKEQNATRITQIIIAIFFRDYWATEEQRKRINKYQEPERREYQKQQKNNTLPQIEQSNLPAEIKPKTGLFSKIKDFFKNIFRRK